MSHPSLERWHQVIKDRELSHLDDLLAENVVFHSPVVHTPQEGKAITKIYLTAASMTLGGEGFEYLREVVDGNNAVLEFQTVIDGILINGVDVIRFDDEGRIADFKVMVRPLKAIQKLHAMMAEMLQSMDEQSKG